MTSPDAAVSTAETEMERLLAAVTGAHPQAKNNIRKLIASARNDALDEAHEKLKSMEASERELAELFRKKDDLDGAVAYSRFANTFALAANAVRALKSSAPAIQTGAEGGGK